MEQVKRFWVETDKRKKFLIIGISALIIIGLTVAIIMISRPQYGLLYGKLSSKDLGEIQNKLTEMSINWKSGEDGQSIFIEQKDVIRVRNDLAYQGLPKESGYTILAALNSTSWTETNYVTKQKISYAQQSELAQQIKSMENILDATVTIDLPEESLFVETEDQEGTASVTVELEDGVQLSQEKVNAIKSIIAGAYRNLEPENVVLVDNFGRLYELPNEEDSMYQIAEQLQIKKTMEEDLNKNLTKILSTVYGSGNVVTQCNIKLNFDKELMESVTYEPPIAGENDGVIRSLERLEEHTKNVATGGVPGTETNVTDYATAEDAVTNIDKKHEVINYEYNEFKKTIQKSPYDIVGVSVSVIIDKALIPEENLTEEYVKEIQTAVEYAAGTGSQVSILTHEFNRPEIAGAEDAAQGGIPIWLIAVFAGVLIAMIVILFLVMRQRKKQKQLEAEAMLVGEEEDESGIDEIDFELDQSDYLVQINNFIDKKPEIVAQLLRTWLNEE